MQQESLFEDKSDTPLASRLRPMSLDKFVGQKHLIGKGKVLYRLIEADRISSLIFWGPPGVGKTTLAMIIAHQTKARFINFSAVAKAKTNPLHAAVISKAKALTAQIVP